MTHVAIVEFGIREDRLVEARAVFELMLETSRTFAGVGRLDWLVGRDEPATWTLYEEWDSWEQEAEYRAFRAGAGAMPELAAVLARPPRLTRLERQDPAE